MIRAAAIAAESAADCISAADLGAVREVDDAAAKRNQRNDGEPEEEGGIAPLVLPELSEAPHGDAS